MDTTRKKLSTHLQPIYDLELTLGNTVNSVYGSGHAALPLTVVFKQPLHRAEIESGMQINPPVRWYGFGPMGGYVAEDTRQSVQGPVSDITKVAQAARQNLSPNLQTIYDIEVALGNTVVRVDEFAGTSCPLAVVFKNPLHRSEIESKIRILPPVHWLEERNEHYSRTGEGAYKCEDTGHAIIGPLPTQR